MFSRNACVAPLLCIGLATAGCATQTNTPVAADDETSVVGSIVSIDTQPWIYDGNAVVQVDTRERGRVAVQLPARWNLCKAAPVDVEALRVGMQVRAVGSVGADGELVVCQRASHRLAPAD